MTSHAFVRFPGFALRTIAAHTLTYFVMGMIASNVLNYTEQFARPEMACWMRQLSDPMVMAGPLVQPLRGIVFALVLFPLRAVLFERPSGWLLTWWLLVGLGILSTFGPAPGSIEGLVYTVIPWQQQLGGWLEVIPQAFFFALLLHVWVRHSETRWLNWSLGTACVLVLLLSALGLLSAGALRS